MTTKDEPKPNSSPEPDDPASFADAALDDILNLGKIPVRSLLQYWFARAMNSEAEWCAEYTRALGESFLEAAEKMHRRDKSLNYNMTGEAIYKLADELEKRQYEASREPRK